MTTSETKPAAAVSKIDVYNRLMREGRWPEARVFRNRVAKEARETGLDAAEAKELSWRELARFFPPGKDEEEEPEEEATPGASPEVEAGSASEDPAASAASVPGAEAEAVEKMLEKLAPVDLFADIRWVYSQLENTRLRPDQAPSAGAWSLLVWARKYQSRFFEQLLPKALAKGPEDEAGVKREKRRVEEIEAMIQKLSEATIIE